MERHMLLRGARFLARIAARTALLATVGLAGCSGGGGGGGSPIHPPVGPNAVLFVSAPPTSLAVNAAATLLAAATFPSANSGGNTAVTWAVTCGSPGACGSFGPNANAAGITYTAPAAIPAGATVTVTASSVADATKLASATITIVAPIQISVTLFATPPASLQVGAQFTFSAAIANDVSANPEVAWTVTCGAAQCGSFNPTSTPNESATLYAAPASIPAGGSVTVTATSITDSTKSASATIVIAAAAPTLADGTYVFQTSGQPGSQASFVTGVLVVSNGNITGGEQDSIDYSTDSNGNLIPNPYFQTITGGSYATTADGNIQISIELGLNSVETLNGTLGTGSQGFVAGLNGAAASGTLDLQTSMAAPTGGYAVSLFGGDDLGAPAWVAGVVNVDGPGTISGSGSVLDVVDGQAAPTGTYAVNASTVSAPDAMGRVQIQLVPASASTLPPIGLAGYLVDATHIRLVGSGNSANFQGVLGGSALGQGSSTGQFSTAGLAGSSYVFGAQGDDAQGPLQIGGVFTAHADGTIAGTLNWNDLTGKAPQSPLSFTGAFAVDPTGRVTLSQLTDGATFHYAMHVYLAAAGNALLLSNDGADVFAGQAFHQRTGALTAANFSGRYGFNATQFTSVTASSGLGPSPVIGSMTAAASGGTDSVSGYADGGNGGADFAVTGSFNARANGIFSGTLAGFNPAARTTAGSFTLYLVDDTQAVMIETDAGQLSLGWLQSVP
jgi:hypothetical protein